MRTHESRWRRTRRLAAVGALATVPALAATPALAAAPSAGPAPAPPQPTGVYLLSLAPASGDGPVKAAMLSCDPDGGTHGAVQAACDQLRAADGKVEAVPESPGACTLEYDPVRVTARGYWNGAGRFFSRAYGNRCAAVRGTGGVIFDF